MPQYQIQEFHNDFVEINDTNGRFSYKIEFRDPTYGGKSRRRLYINELPVAGYLSNFEASIFLWLLKILLNRTIQKMNQRIGRKESER